MSQNPESGKPGYDRAKHVWLRQLWGYITGWAILYSGFCVLFFKFFSHKMSLQDADTVFSGIAFGYMSLLIAVPIHLVAAIMLARVARHRPKFAYLEISVVLGFTLVEAFVVVGYAIYFVLYFRPG